MATITLGYRHDPKPPEPVEYWVYVTTIGGTSQWLYYINSISFEDNNGNPVKTTETGLMVVVASLGGGAPIAGVILGANVSSWSGISDSQVMDYEDGWGVEFKGNSQALPSASDYGVIWKYNINGGQYIGTV
jgi:hypothetical protein